MWTDKDRVPDFAAPGEGGFRAFIDWLNELLYPAFGTAQLGDHDNVNPDADDAVTKAANAVCATCDQPMKAHTVRVSTQDPRIYCPE